MTDRTALAKHFRENADRLDGIFHTTITAEDLREAADELDRPVARDGYDPNGWATMLTALRNANDGFVLTIWNKSENGDAGYKVWRTLDGHYAERDPGFAMNIPIHELCGELDKAIKEQPAMSSGGAELSKVAAPAARDDVIEECARVADKYSGPNRDIVWNGCAEALREPDEAKRKLFRDAASDLDAMKANSDAFKEAVAAAAAFFHKHPEINTGMSLGHRYTVEGWVAVEKYLAERIGAAPGHFAAANMLRQIAKREGRLEDHDRALLNVLAEYFEKLRQVIR